jgi:hypothetical protein
VYSIGDGAVWYVRSADGGSTWELPWKVIPSDADSYDDITLGITSDNKVCVVARAVSSGNYNIIYYAWSSDGGSSWGTVSSASPQDWDLAESHWEMYPNPSDTTKLKLFTTSNPNLSQIYELDFAYGSAPTLAATYNLKDIFADSKNIQKISLSYKSGYWYVLVYTLTTSSYKIIALCKMSSGVITLLETYVNQTSGIPGVEMAYQPYNGIQVAQIDGYYRLDSANYIYLKFLWSHKLMGLSTPSKIMGATPTKVMGIQ